MESSTALPSSTRKKRLRAVALSAVALAVSVTVATFVLGGTGSIGLSIAPPPGASKGVAEVTPMESEVTRSKGAAQLDAGVALARIAVAEAYATKIQVLVAWTDVREAANVLRNPNAQISVGLYHPVHTGQCASSNEAVGKEGNVVAPEVTVKDAGSNQVLCVKLDEKAKGSASVSEKGKLLLGRTLISGFMDAKEAPGTPAECKSTGTAWCTTEVMAEEAHESQDALYVIASIVTPGGNPQGQQPTGAELKFFTHVRRLS